LVSDDGTTQTHNLLGLSLIQQDDGSQTRTLLADGLGSVRVEMVGDAIDSATTYEPYGKLLARSGASGTVYGYTGEQHDAATGLVYLRARYYNPNLKVFMSRDPFPGFAFVPQTQHPYTYVGNNPANLTDPSGEIAPILVAMGIGAAVGSGIGAVAGGASYVLAHPGGNAYDYIHNPEFRRAVGIGAATGFVGGAVGGGVGWLVPAGTGIGAVFASGAFGGSVSGIAEQLVYNALVPCTEWYDNLAQAAVLGGLTGGIASGATSFVRPHYFRAFGTRTEDIYAALGKTKFGAYFMPRATKYGNPTTVFNDKLPLGDWGSYYAYQHILELNPIFRELPPEFAAPALAHELVHRQARWFSSSQAQEVAAHAVEAVVWKELRESGAVRVNPLYPDIAAQYRFIRSENNILDMSYDASSLWVHVQEHHVYRHHGVYSRDLANLPGDHFQKKYYEDRIRELGR
jgi:RHS repeat-associated protein